MNLESLPDKINTDFRVREAEKPNSRLWQIEYVDVTTFEAASWVCQGIQTISVMT